MTIAESGPQRLRVLIRGAVQGVGFRPFVYRLASELNLRGWVINASSGVVVEVKDMDYELVAKATTLQLYLRDHGKPAAMLAGPVRRVLPGNVRAKRGFY